MTGPLKNSRHERFAQELAKGRSQVEAYAASGYAANDGHAARLAGNGRIQERLTELKGKAAERTVVTVASLTDRLLAIAAKGEAKDDAPMLTVARAAIMDAAKLNGFIVDKVERKMTDEQITEIIHIVMQVPGGGAAMKALLAG